MIVLITQNSICNISPHSSLIITRMFWTIMKNQNKKQNKTKKQKTKNKRKERKKEKKERKKNQDRLDVDPGQRD